MQSWLDYDPPANASLAKAYWCDMNYFLAHTASGAHPDCNCPPSEGHNDPNVEKLYAEYEATPRIFIARRVGYVDDREYTLREVDRYELSSFGDPATAVDVIEGVVRSHIAAQAEELSAIDRALQEAQTLANALRAYRRLSTGDGHMNMHRDIITDSYAYRSELRIWREPDVD